MNFTDIHRRGATFTRGAAGGGVRGLHPAGQVPERAPRRVRASAARCSCRCCTSMDLSLTQDVFKNIKGKRNAGQFRIDIQNFGNLLNSNWGVGQRVIRNNILTTPRPSTRSGRSATACRCVNNQLVTQDASNRRAACSTSTSSCSASGIRSTNGLRGLGLERPEAAITKGRVFGPAPFLLGLSVEFPLWIPDRAAHSLRPPLSSGRLVSHRWTD